VDITASEISVQFQAPLSSLSPTQGRARRKVSGVSFAEFFSKCLTKIASFRCKLCVAWGSLRAHTAHQFATKETRVDLGSACLFQDGCWQANKGTLARAEGIKKFLANHAWADTLDLRTFLNGFDAGEEYCMDAHRLEVGSQESHNTQRTQKLEHRP
jgi:hypothetical protein